MSLAGAIADARKSATRLYVNNFADKGRQNTIDLLLGRLMGQAPVDLYDPVNDFVIAEVSRRSPEYTSSKSIRIWCGTFNLNGKSQGASEDLSPWLCSTFVQSRSDPEIMAVGFQEIVELSPQQIMSTDPARRITWENAVKKTINSNVNRSLSDDYVLLRSGQLVGAALMIFVKASVLDQVKNVEGSIKKTGMSGIAGNKGAVAIRLEYASTSLCFVTAHLAAGFANYEERNRDYSTISHGLRFQKNRSIDDHNSVIWFGDFNYRVGLSDERARRLVQTGDLETLYDNDQLNIQMVAGIAFQYYSESRINFPPTYRFDIGTDDYDTSEKARIPAWTDRILRRGNNLRQIDYNVAPLRFSDHRPVFATFECKITIVDEAVRAALSKKLYDKRKKEVGTTHAAADGANEDVESNTDDEADLAGYDSIAPDLPPASSDRRKWWLDNDKPARSDLQPPAKGMVPNPNRAVNPYRSDMTDESDWVDVRLHSSREGSRLRSRTESNQKPEPPPARKVGRSISTTSAVGTTESKIKLSDNHRDLLRNISSETEERSPPPRPASRSLYRSSSSASTAALKKAPPPKPKKPSSLASPPSQTSTFPLASLDHIKTAERDPTSTSQTAATTKAPFVQPRLAKQNPILSTEHSTSEEPMPHSSPPPLPSRTNTSSSTSTDLLRNTNHATQSELPSRTATLRKPVPPSTQPRRAASSAVLPSAGANTGGRTSKNTRKSEEAIDLLMMNEEEEEGEAKDDAAGGGRGGKMEARDHQGQRSGSGDRTAGGGGGRTALLRDWKPLQPT